MALLKKIEAGVFGHAIGDALGVPAEFRSRERMKREPITDMIGHGSHDQPVGTWSDDTSMEIALMESIINTRKVDYDDIMLNFAEWLLNDKYTATGTVFDMGRTSSKAIYNYMHNNDVNSCGCTDEKSNGNGSLMRILPVAFLSYEHELDDDKRYYLTRNVSALTHAHEISVMGCYIYVTFVVRLLECGDKVEAYRQVRDGSYAMFSDEARDAYRRVLDENIAELSEDEISSRGYVVSSLEAALWSLLTADNYSDVVLKAINLGGDTDTIGAIAGSMAGICYPDTILDRWLHRLQRRDYIEQVCAEFADILPRIPL